MNLIGDNNDFIVFNNNFIALTISIVNGEVMPFSCKLNQIVLDRLTVLLFDKLESATLLLRSNQTKQIENVTDFVSNGEFFAKLPSEIVLTSANLNIAQFLFQNLTITKSRIEIPPSNLGIDFENSELPDGKYIVNLIEADSGSVFKYTDVENYCFNQADKGNTKLGFSSTGMINDTIFVNSLITHKHKRICIKINLSSNSVGQVQTYEEKKAFEKLAKKWPEIQFRIVGKDVFIENLNTLLMCNMDAQERDLFIASNSDDCILQCECFLDSPTIRSFIAYRKI